MNEDPLRRARRFAIEAHGSIDHRRKYTDEPYHVHPAAVAAKVATVSDDPDLIAAAWLHDTVEDTPVTLEDIEREFGPRIGALVKNLTDVSKPEDGNRKVRKTLDREHSAKGSAGAKTVKLADLIDNAVSIITHDPGFARRFMGEMELLLEVLKEGDGTLMAEAQGIVRDYRAGKFRKHRKS